MKKVGKIVMVGVAVAATMAVGLACAACDNGGSGAENLGTYTYNYSVHQTIAQGALMNSYSDVLLIKSDGTFEVTCVYDSYYSSDGESFNPVMYLACGVFGNYEVTDEDAELGEKTIKITEVTAYYTSSAEYTKFEKGAEGFTENAGYAKIFEFEGKEFILTSEYKLNKSLEVFKF